MSAIIAWQSCRGTLSLDDYSVPVRCSVEFSEKGELSVHFDDIRLDRQNAWLLHASHTDDGPLVRFFTFDVTADSGETLKSDRVYFTSVSTPIVHGRTILRLTGEAQSLEAVAEAEIPPSTDDVHQLLYHTVGMLGLGRVRGECIEGDIVAEGPSHEPAESILYGQIHIRRGEVVDHDSWVAACDKRVLSTLRAMSLALGRPIDWVTCEHYVNGQRVRSRFFYAVRLLPAAEPVFTHLDLQPVLDLALRNHGRLLDPDLRLGEAIDWVVQWHVEAEIRFLAAVTAFEGLLAGHSEAIGGLIPNACFRDKIRPWLEAALSNCEVREAVREALGPGAIASQVDDVLDEMARKLGSLNQRSLPARLLQFLQHYDVPIDDLPVSVIELLRTRNRLVHGGRTTAVEYEERTTGRAGMMREVLRRSILAMLGYSGPFCSYLKGAEWLTFRDPPTRVG